MTRAGTAEPCFGASLQPAAAGFPQGACGRLTNRKKNQGRIATDSRDEAQYNPNRQVRSLSYRPGACDTEPVYPLTSNLLDGHVGAKLHGLMGHFTAACAQGYAGDKRQDNNGSQLHSLLS
jgi:hypothetical protein